jgi:hypothetical protein
MPNTEHEYIGDGVYASFDGYQVWLHLGSHDSPPLIALEPNVMAALVRYAERIDRLRAGK